MSVSGVAAHVLLERRPPVAGLHVARLAPVFIAGYKARREALLLQRKRLAAGHGAGAAGQDCRDDEDWSDFLCSAAPYLNNSSARILLGVLLHLLQMSFLVRPRLERGL